ncbi:MAG: heme-binding protein [Phycisphaerales bacterium]
MRANHSSENTNHPDRPTIAQALTTALGLTVGLSMAPGAGAAFIDCGADGCSAAHEHTKTTSPIVALAQEDDWTTLRVGGDLFAQVETMTKDGRPNGYRYTRSGWDFMMQAGVDADLVEGYPAPTPPGAIEVKRYPSDRRAVYGEQGGETGQMGSRGFWPLFRHIQRNDIKMTTPVVMGYDGVDSANDESIDAWSMAFLYSSKSIGSTGPAEGGVEVIESEPVTVVAIGQRGSSESVDDLRGSLDELEAWLDANPEWERAGEPRVLGYNGPMTPWYARWWETQIPVRLSADDHAH